MPSRAETPGQILGAILPAAIEAAGFFAALFAPSDDDWTALHLLALHPAAVRCVTDAGDAELSRWREAGRSGAPADAILPWQTASGAIVRRTSILPLRHPSDGRALLCLLAHDDMLERRARQEDAATRTLLAAAFVSVDAAVVILRQDGRIATANVAALRLTATGAAELANRHLTELLDPEDARVVLEAHRRQSEDGQNWRLPARLHRANGDTRDVTLVSVIAQPLGLDQFRIVTVHETPPPTAPPPSPAAVRQLISNLPLDALLIAGKIRLIGLSDVRQSFGPNWPIVAERALALAERTLAAGLGAGDSFSRTEDEGFVICFAEGSEEEATLRAYAMARDIRRQLLTDPEAHAAHQVSAIAATIQADAALAADPDLVATLSARLEGQRSDLAEQARARLAAALARAAYRREALSDNAERAVPIAWIAPAPALQRRIDLARAGGLDEAAESLDLDALALRLAADAVTADMAACQPGICLAEIGFAAFANRKRAQRLFDALAAISPLVRQRMIVMLADLPPGLPQARIADLVQRLRPDCRGVGLRLDDIDNQPLESAQHPVSIIAFEAPMLLRAFAAHASAVTHVLREIRRARARVLARHVASPIQAARLRSLDIDLLSYAEGLDLPAPPASVQHAKEFTISIK